MRKKETAKTLKLKAWRKFSEYIRRIHSDNDGNVVCVTCGKLMHWKDSQAGHFVGSRNNTVLLREDLVHPQCAGCNVFLHGNQGKYVIFMMETYNLTRRKIDSLLNLRHKTKRMTKADWEDEVVKWTEKLNKLKEL